MTARLPFTEASLRRAVRAARKAGLRVTAINMTTGKIDVVQDGCTPLPDSASLVQTNGTPAVPQDAWGDVEA